MNATEDLLETNELGGSRVKSTRLSSDSDDDAGGRLCGTHRCEPGTGHCEQMRDGPLCVCVEGHYGLDCQQRTHPTALFKAASTIVGRPYMFYLCPFYIWNNPVHISEVWS